MREQFTVPTLSHGFLYVAKKNGGDFPVQHGEFCFTRGGPYLSFRIIFEQITTVPLAQKVAALHFEPVKCQRVEEVLPHK